MKTRRILVGMIAGAIFLAPLLLAQWPSFPTADVPKTGDAKPDLAGPTPRTADGKPDLSGIWEYRGRPGGAGGRGVGGTITARGANTNAPAPPPAAAPAAAPAARQQPPAPEFTEGPPLATFFNIGAGFKDGLPYTPWAADLHKQRESVHAMDNPDAHCLPLGLTQLHMHPQPRKIIQTPKLIVILYEAQGGVRQIFMDGRKLPNNDPDPWWYGYSIGRWEGDTLIVETTGFRDDVWLDVNGSPLTSTGKMTERIRRPNYGNLEIDVTVEDPKAYTKPFTVRVNQRILLNNELIEFVCNENEKDSLHYIPDKK
jgi:hypothetical protein